MKNLKKYLIAVAAVLSSALAYSQIAVVAETDATILANNLIGSESGVTIVSATYTGAALASGTFSGGDFGIAEGLLLTTGSVGIAVGPNNLAGAGYSNGAPGDADLNAIISPYVTYNASVLEITFIPEGNSLEFTYVFASEEYNEYVCSTFNDAFAFIVNGGAYTNQNIALIPGTTPPMPVAINNVNNGTSGTYGSSNNCTDDQLSNTAFYIDNFGGENIQYDGYTVPLAAVIAVVPGVQYTIKLVIADAGDTVLDSGVFLEGQSFVSVICDAGDIAFIGTDNTSKEFCANALPSVINVTNDGEGTNDTYRYVVTKTNGMILSIGASSSISTEGWIPGTYSIYGISYSGNLIGLTEGAEIGDLSADGCYDLDGPIVVIVNECEEEFDCPDLSANIGDTCDDGDDMTENDVINENCVCAGIAIIVVYDCDDLMANIGDACDDGNSMTENDMVNEDCICAGTQIEFDCPQWGANIGYPCELEVGMGVLNSDCECVGITIPECENFVYYLSDHAAAEGISDIYEISLGGGNATMTYIETSPIEVHIAFNAHDSLIYAISKHENSYRTLNPLTAAWGPEVSLGADYGEITAAVFNHDGKLLFGSQTQKVIYSVNVTTNVVSTYDTYSPLSGGDLAFSSDGMLYMATRSGNGLYKVWTDPMPDDLIGSLPAKVTGLAITDADQLLISAQGNTSLVLRNADGTDAMISFNLMLDGEPYTLRDGDMASGCFAPFGDIYCQDFSTFLANHGTGITGSDIYTVDFTAGKANLTWLTNVDFETHIAFDAMTNTLFLVNVNGAFVRLYDVGTNAPIGDLPIVGSFNKLTAAVYNPKDSLLYVGDHSLDQIHSINLTSGIATYYGDAPVSGGDLEILDDGTIYLGTKEGSALYKAVEGGSAVFVGNTVPNITGMARANNNVNSFITSNNGATALTRISAMDGSTITSYPIMLGGVPFTLTDGDMTAGCADPDPIVVYGGCNATEVVEYVEGTTLGGGTIALNRTDPNQALGAPERVDGLVFVSLGYGGSLTLAFDGAIPNGPGDDIEIVETSFGQPSCSAYPEYADVYVSVDGASWHFAKQVCRTNGFVDISDAGDFDHVYFVKIVNNDAATTTHDGFDVDGVVAIYNCIDDEENTPMLTTTSQSSSTLTSYPNPTQGPSKVMFTTGETTRTLIEVYDMSGRHIGTLFNQEAQQDKEYTLDFNGNNLPNGVYIYRMTTNNENIVEKFMIAR